MNRVEPPRVARFLVERLAPPNEAALGDLSEVSHRGLSVAWYWFQALGLIVSGVAQAVKRDPSLGIRVIFTGIGLSTVMDLSFVRLWSVTVSQPLAELTQALWGQSNFQTPYQCVFVLAWIPVATLKGWLLTRLHREQRGTAAILYSVLIIPWGLPFFGSYLADAINIGQFLYTFQRFPPAITVSVIGMIAGALIESRHESSAAATSTSANA